MRQNDMAHNKGTYSNTTSAYYVEIAKVEL